MHGELAGKVAESGWAGQAGACPTLYAKPTRADPVLSAQIQVNLSKAGIRSTYLTAWIARDRPDLLVLLKAGEFTCVRATARAAGILQIIYREIFVEVYSIALDAFMQGIIEHVYETKLGEGKDALKARYQTALSAFSQRGLSE